MFLEEEVWTEDRANDRNWYEEKGEIEEIGYTERKEGSCPRSSIEREIEWIERWWNVRKTTRKV